MKHTSVRASRQTIPTRSVSEVERKSSLRLRVSVAFLTALFIGAPVQAQTGDQSKKEQPLDFDGLKALKHADPAVRLRAAQVLVDLGAVAKFAVPALREQWKEEKNAVVRVKLTEALWVIDKPPARTLLPVLLEALTDKDETARANAANVMGQLGSGARSAVPALAKTLQDKALMVRIAAALALGELGPAAKDAVPALMDTLKNDDAFLLEPFVLGTLGKIGEDAVPYLKTALTAKEAPLRRGSAYALALIGAAAADAVEPLGDMLSDPDAELRAQAARTLGKIGKPAKSKTPLLIKLLADKDNLSRIEAAVALWRVDKIGAGVPVLVQAMKHDSARVREQACKALGEVSESKLVPVAAVCEGLKDTAPAVRAQAAETLGNIGSPAADALPALRLAFKDDNAFVRVQAATAVWRIDRQAGDVMPAFILWLGDKDQLVRKTAAAGLGAMGADARPAWDALLGLYRDDAVFQVQRAAGIALRQIDLKAAVKAGVR